MLTYKFNPVTLYCMVQYHTVFYFHHTAHSSLLISAWSIYPLAIFLTSLCRTICFIHFTHLYMYVCMYLCIYVFMYCTKTGKLHSSNIRNHMTWVYLLLVWNITNKNTEHFCVLCTEVQVRVYKYISLEN
jgi:hypothetical protein